MSIPTFAPIRRIESDPAASLAFASTMADALEGGGAITDLAREAMPALAAELRAFGRADLDVVAARLEVFA